MPWKPQDGDEFPTLGYEVADWIEAYCCHGPGDVQGDPITLDREWLQFLVDAYRLDPRTGKRQVDRALLSRPKGRAKSELAGFVTVAEALGPVRFDGWDADGQPVGRRVRSPLIKCLATEESQAGNTFENAAFIAGDWGPDVHPDVYAGVSGIRVYQSATALYLPFGRRDPGLHGGFGVQGRRQGDVRRPRRDPPVRAARAEVDVRDGGPQHRQARAGRAVDDAHHDRLPAR